MIRRILIFVVVLIAILGGLGLAVLNGLGAFFEGEQVFVGECERIDGFPGAEDLVVDPASGMAFVSSHDRRAGGEGRGAIYLLPRGGMSGAAPIDATGGMPEAFAPHGLSLTMDGEGNQHLLVINHAARDPDTERRVSSIEVYAVGEDHRLSHQRTIIDPAIRNPNDLAALSPTEFYVTNDLRAAKENETGALLEVALRRPGGSVAYFRDDAAEIVAEGLQFANGIALSPDRSQIFVADMMSRAVRVYERNMVTGMLAPLRAIDTAPYFPDNLDFAADRTLWIGGHGNLMQLTRHGEDPNEIAPGAVLDVPVNGTRATPRFATSGELISGISVGARRGRQVLIGSVFEPHILSCTIAD